MANPMFMLVLLGCLLIPTQIFAQDVRGMYCVISESEWNECVEFKIDSKCIIITETWEPADGPGPRKIDRSVTACTYAVQNGRVIVIHGQTTEHLELGLYDWDEFGGHGWSPGLKRIEPAPPESILGDLVYWKEPMDELRLWPKPR